MNKFLLASVALGWFVSPWFFVFTAFVAVNLMQSAFTDWCPVLAILRRAGVPEGSAPVAHEKVTEKAA